MPPDPTAILDCIIWYPAPRGSLSGFKKVKIRDFWYGFKNDIPTGIKQSVTKKEYKKIF